MPDTPLQNDNPSPAWRENRLYQVSYLLKDYGCRVSDLDDIFNEYGFLTNDDPKMRLASTNRDLFPVDINSATREELLRVPGIGPISVNRIVKMRPITSDNELIRMGVVISRARPFIEVNGCKQTDLTSFLAGVS